MIRETITIDDALRVLNRAFEADREAITNLRSSKIVCNKALAHDPEIQCCEDGYYWVGFLGIINGLFGVDQETGFGAIAAEYDTENDVIRRFARVNHEAVKDAKKSIA